MFSWFWNAFHFLILSIVMVSLSIGTSEGMSDDEWFSLNVTMRNYQSSKEDEIVFMQYQLPDEELTILGYTPMVSMTTVHHMNMFACERPASRESVWLGGIPCDVGAYMLLYGWDRDALPFRFPADVGVLVGKNTPYRYVVVNIHYLPIVKNDHSGNQIIFGRKRPRHLVGVMSGGTTHISLPPKSYNVTAPFSCQYKGQQLSIFAVGVHAHRYARVNSVYRLRGLNLTLIAKVDPQQIHQSYVLSTPIDIIAGDYVIGQCIYDNTEDRVIKNGLRHDDEMCNVMIGYWYAFSDHGGQQASVPFENCWGDTFPDLSLLIPTDSLVLPSNQTALNSITPVVLVLNNATNETMVDRHLKSFFIYFATGISLYLFLCILCLNLSCYRHFTICNSTFLGIWRRNDGFDRLKTYLDEEIEIDSA